MSHGYVENKSTLVKRLYRIEGQVRGSSACRGGAVLHRHSLPISAPSDTALESLAFQILDGTHVGHCVTGALAAGSSRRRRGEEPRARSTRCIASTRTARRSSLRAYNRSDH